MITQAESRQLNAKHLLDIVLNCFTPQEVTKAVNELLAEPAWNQRELYLAILSAIRKLENIAQNSTRTIDMLVFPVCTSREAFKNLQREEIATAVAQLAAASQGGMTLRDDKIIIHVSLDELERRLSGLTGQSATPRKLSNLRKYNE